MRDRKETIKRIKTALQTRSGKTWSVTGGRGTSWGYLTISAPPARCSEDFGYIGDEDRAELGRLLGFASPVHNRGALVAPYEWELYERLAAGTETRPTAEAPIPEALPAAPESPAAPPEPKPVSISERLDILARECWAGETSIAGALFRAYTEGANDTAELAAMMGGAR